MSTVRKAAVGGLVLAAAGIFVQMAGGADYPVVPPGAIVLVAGAVLIAIRTRWTPLIGVMIAIFISFGAVVTPNMGDQLSEPSEATVFIGTAIQLVGLVAGLVAGLVVAAGCLRKEQTR
jgi:hypothetical protein